MALLGALSTARSGLIANGVALGVIGNNIANVNTFGFKGSRAEFADLVALQAGGGEAGKIGLGTRIGRIAPAVTQGNIESTTRPNDLAIDGNGFFVVGNGQGGFLYTRAGNFTIDRDGRLVTFQGLAVQGFALNDLGQPAAALADIAVNGAASQPSPTTLVTLKANLQADAPIITGGFDGTTFDSAFASSNFTTSVDVFDSLGARHTLNLFFTRTAPNAWDYNIGVDDGEVGGTAGALNVLGNGTLTFNTDGSLNATAPDPPTVSVTFNGATAQDIDFNFGTPNTDIVANPGLGVDGITQFASTSAVSAQAQNGFGAGQLIGLDYSQTGVVSGVFDNGQTRPLFQLALANFTAPDQLTPLGDGLFRESIDSGAPAIGSPGSGGFGDVVAGSIEQSNVSLVQEFIDLISTQRAFQANARVITTGDAVLNDLVNVVR